MLIESKRISPELSHIVWETKVFQTTHLCFQNTINQNRVHLKQVQLISLIQYQVCKHGHNPTLTNRIDAISRFITLSVIKEDKLC